MIEWVIESVRVSAGSSYLFGDSHFFGERFGDANDDEEDV